MHELEMQGRSKEDVIFDLGDARHAFSALRRPKRWEVIWMGDVAVGAEPPEATSLLGYDVTNLASIFFSAICDCMCFPRWHGCDIEGTLLAIF